MAVELRNRLKAGLGCPIRATLIFDYPTLEALVDYLIQEVLVFSSETDMDTSPEEKISDLNLSELLEQLSDSEAESLIAQSNNAK
jgi:myxalamid-type polyketide synthase MxaB